MIPLKWRQKDLGGGGGLMSCTTSLLSRLQSAARASRLPNGSPGVASQPVGRRCGLDWHPPPRNGLGLNAGLFGFEVGGVREVEAAAALRHGPPSCSFCPSSWSETSISVRWACLTMSAAMRRICVDGLKTRKASWKACFRGHPFSSNGIGASPVTAAIGR